MAEKIILTDAAFNYVKTLIAKHPKIKTAINKGDYPTPSDEVLLELKKREVITTSPGRYSKLTINVPLSQLAGGGTFRAPVKRGPKAKSKVSAVHALPAEMTGPRYSYDALATLIEDIEPLVDEKKAEKSRSLEAEIAKLKAHIATADGDDLANTAKALTRILKARDALFHAAMVEVLDDLARGAGRAALRSVIAAMRADHSAAKDSLERSASATA